VTLGANDVRDSIVVSNRTTEMPNGEFARYSPESSARELRGAHNGECHNRNSSNRTEGLQTLLRREKVIL
jgi:hypothetical protein